jgi:hypothetical protein
VHHEWLFREPALVVSAERQSLDYHETDEMSELLRIENRTLVEHQNIAFQPPVFTPPVGATPVFSPPSVPILAAGNSTGTRLRGDVPPPGDYDVAVQFVSSAGLLRSRRKQSINLALHVWRDTPEIAWVKTYPEPQAMILIGELRTGRMAAKGVQCEVTLVGHSEVTKAIAAGAGVRTSQPWEIVGSAEKAAGNLVLESNPRPEFGKATFRLALGPLLPSTNWTYVQQNLKSFCSEMTGGPS